MKSMRLKAGILSLAVVGAGLIPVASHAWSMRQNINQGHSNYVTAQNWCGSYYSSYPCQQQQQYGYTSTHYTNFNTYQYANYQYPTYQYSPTSYYYPTTYASQNLTGQYGYGGTGTNGYNMYSQVYPNNGNNRYTNNINLKYNYNNNYGYGGYDYDDYDDYDVYDYGGYNGFYYYY